MNFKKIMRIIATAPILLLLSGCSCFGTNANDKQTFVVLGDSIAAGYGVDPSQTYGTLISSSAGYLYNNKAVSGDKSENMIMHFENEEYQSAVKSALFISISIGGNNFLQLPNEDKLELVAHGSNGSLATKLLVDLKADLETIVGKIRALNPDCRIYFQTVYNCIKGTTDSTFQLVANTFTELLTMFNQVYYDIAEFDENCAVVDVATAFEKPCRSTNSTDYMQSDWIHPNENGHKCIADAYLDTLQAEGFIQ